MTKMHGTLVAAPERAAVMRAMIERVTLARAAGDVEAVLAELSDDVHYEVMGQIAGQPISPVIRGRVALRSHFKGLFERWVWNGMTVRNIVIGTDNAAVETTGTMIHTVSNQRFQTDFCAMLGFRDGKISTIREYCDSFTIVRIAGLAM
ncbi:MAG: nuclear transport factor 2 family protein [Beijerinckiaceae bacterium]|nr:nuclear transport factor 2 family protein [Beijerinckiaceae bacterium]MCZ8301219.1 nuclear transport factor 2 family protein [Beijerinckiaceae bacterium]